MTSPVISAASQIAEPPARLLGCGPAVLRAQQEGIEDPNSIAALGLRSVMLPGNRAAQAHHAAAYDPFWEAADETGRVPHFMVRMDHAQKRHRCWLPDGQELSMQPSAYFRENMVQLDGIDAAQFALIRGSASRAGQRLAPGAASDAQAATLSFSAGDSFSVASKSAESHGGISPPLTTRSIDRKASLLRSAGRLCQLEKSSFSRADPANHADGASFACHDSEPESEWQP